MQVCIYMYVCIYIYIYVYIYIYYIRARDDCNRHLQHVKSIRKGYTCAQKHSFHCHQTGFVLFQTPWIKEVFGSQRTLFRSVSGYSPAVCSPKQWTEAKNRTSQAFCCRVSRQCWSLPIPRSWNTRSGWPKSRSHEFCWGKGVGYKMGGLFAEMFEGSKPRNLQKELANYAKLGGFVYNQWFG